MTNFDADVAIVGAGPAGSRTARNAARAGLRVKAVVTLARTAHVVAEESGAAATAGALQVAERLRGKKVAIIVSGGNMTIDHLRRVLLEVVPG